jgi:hypothetical protein
VELRNKASNEVWAVIPARGGSKGITRKNIYPLDGRPLISYSIEAAKKCALIDRIFVSTDSPEIAQVATENGAMVPVMRPPNLSSDTSSITKAFWHGVDSGVDSTKIVPSKILVLYPTAPFRPPGLLEEAIHKLDDAITYRTCQVIGHEKGYFVPTENRSMRQIYTGRGLKQLGLVFGIRYFPPGFRPGLKGSRFESYLSQMTYKGGGTSIRIFDKNSIPWTIDIDVIEDIEKAEWYLRHAG